MASQPSKSSSWRDTVLDQLTPGLSDYFVVEDPDHLMTESGIQGQLIQRGFEFYPFDNSIELRHFYELKIRRKQAVKEPVGQTNQHVKSLVISIDTELSSIRDLPYDITKNSKIVSLSLSDCFPELFQDVLKRLEPEELDSVERAVSEYTPGRLGDTASRDFVLRHIYQVAPEVIQTSADLLRTLLRIHYRDIVLPEILKKRLSELLSKRTQFQDWPLEEIISDSQSFFRFLQNHWPTYVAAVQNSSPVGIKKSPAVYTVHSLKSPEPEITLPFGHDDVRIYIDNLFLEGFLAAIEIDFPDDLLGHWCLIGIKQDLDKEIKKHITGLVSLCHDTLPDENARHQAWLQFASRWAELCSLHHTNKDVLDDGFPDLMNLVDGQFKAWMLSKYNSLHNHPPSPPVMLNHIPRSMAREIDSSKTSKTALILIDGLALDQWVTLRNSINISHIMIESSVFAWVPTVTSVSRQALFSVKAPYQFSRTIHTTSAEPKAWQQYWLEQGLDSSEVFYQKSLGRDDVSILIDRLSDHRLRSVGLIINTVDDIMHGMLLGSSGMHNQIELWGNSGYLTQLIDALINYGFTIHLTSDHGNVEASGCGKISEGAVADSRGERARVYPTETLRADIYKKIENETDSAVLWPQIGLPSDYWSVVMSEREAFVAKNQNIVGHGGIAIEEVIVPYINISRVSEKVEKS